MGCNAVLSVSGLRYIHVVARHDTWYQLPGEVQIVIL